MIDNMMLEVKRVAVSSGIPSWFDTEVHILEPRLQLSGIRFLTRDFAETEPNNTLQQANHVGTLYPYQVVQISGHLNGHSDPFDYFDFNAAAPGDIVIAMRRDSDGAILYHDVLKGVHPTDLKYFEGFATGNADFSYHTDIVLISPT